MRLKKALNKNIETLVKILESDCDTFLKEIKGGTLTGKNNFARDGWVLRGVTDTGPVVNGLIKKKSHIDNGRKPRGASQLYHNLTNICGKQVFGWPIRDGVPTRGIGGLAVGDVRIFGINRIFLPIGNYDYVWSPNIRDFNDNDMALIFKKTKMYEAILVINRYYEGQDADAQEELWERGLNFTYQEVYAEALKGVKQFIKDNYKNDKIHGAIEMGNEVSFKCDEYYLVDDNYTFERALELGGWR